MEAVRMQQSKDARREFVAKRKLVKELLLEYGTKFLELESQMVISVKPSALWNKITHVSPAWHIQGLPSGAVLFTATIVPGKDLDPNKLLDMEHPRTFLNDRYDTYRKIIARLIKEADTLLCM